jgi:hypothetical protein
LSFRVVVASDNLEVVLFAFVSQVANLRRVFAQEAAAVDSPEFCEIVAIRVLFSEPQALFLSFLKKEGLFCFSPSEFNRFLSFSFRLFIQTLK